jgi:hypothetical protein
MKRNGRQAKQKRQEHALTRLRKKTIHLTDGNRCFCDMCNREHYNDSRNREIHTLSKRLQGDKK